MREYLLSCNSQNLGIINLFLSEVELNRNTRKIKITSNFVFKIPFIWVFYVLRKIAKESKTWDFSW